MGNTTSQSKSASFKHFGSKPIESKLESKFEPKLSKAESTPSKFPGPSRLLTSQPTDTATLCWSFLDARDIEKLSRSGKSIKSKFSDTLTEKKKASELLTHVFNADPKMVKEFLTPQAIVDSKESESKESKSSELIRNQLSLKKTPIKYCVVLTKSSCREEYFSPSKNKTMIKRTWKNISPLQAAAWCGDIYLVNELLKHIPRTKIQRDEAAKQLLEILNRKETAENGAMLAPFKALLNAYTKFNAEYKALYDAGKSKKIDKLWDEVWQCQRRLPTYGLQVYCDDYSNQVFSFLQEPTRYCFLEYGKILLDLDSMKAGHALARLGVGRACVVKMTKKFWHKYWEVGFMNNEPEAIIQLCELRPIGLSTIIQNLMPPSPSEDSDSPEAENLADRPGFSLG